MSKSMSRFFRLSAKRDLKEELMKIPSEHRDSAISINKIDSRSTIDAPERPLSTLSSNEMNANKASTESSSRSKTVNGTIRSVPVESLHIPASPSPAPSPETNRRTDSSAMPHSTTLSYMPHSQPPLTHQNALNTGRGLVRAISSEFGGPIGGVSRTLSTNNVPDTSGSNANGDPQWSSAVGRANLGKSGRVIEKLMADSDTLRRDLNYERLKASEARDAVKFLQEQMQQTAEANSGILHDAAVNKTLLKRKERQVDELTAELEVMKQRCTETLEREQAWKDEAERIRRDAQEEVEDAKTRATMMEGRVNTMANHWKDQEKKAEKHVSSVRKEIAIIVEQRREDDRKIVKLQTVCSQQDEHLETLRQQNAALQAQHEAYKLEQERGLADIKEAARLRDEQGEVLLAELQKTLGELKWALNVKENVRGAQ